MKIENIQIDTLIPYINNTRTHNDEQVDQIAASIKEFGFTNPVLIDQDGGIIAGHGRIMGAKKLNIDEVPCIRLSHLSETQKKAYIIVDNKLALNAGWDEEVLKVEMEGLFADEFDIDLLGFTMGELDDLNINLDEDCVDLDEDKVDNIPETVSNPVIKLGDLVEMGEHKLLCGSATKEEDIAKLMGSDLADQLVTDPPYNVAYEGKTKEAMTMQNDSMDNDSFRTFLRDAFKNANTYMKEGGGILYMARGFRGLQFPWCVFRYRLENSSVFSLEETRYGEGSARLPLEARALPIRVERWCWASMGYRQKTNDYLGV